MCLLKEWVSGREWEWEGVGVGSYQNCSSNFSCLVINSPLRWGVYIVIAGFIFFIIIIIILHKVANAYNSESKIFTYMKFQSHIGQAKFSKVPKFHDKIS